MDHGGQQGVAAAIAAPNSLGSSFVGRSEVSGRAGRCLGHLLESAAGRVASAGSVGPPRLGRPAAGSRREARRLPGRRGSRQQPARGSRDALIGRWESRTRGSRSAARAFICVAAALFLGSGHVARRPRHSGTPPGTAVRRRVGESPLRAPTSPAPELHQRNPSDALATAQRQDLSIRSDYNCGSFAKGPSAIFVNEITGGVQGTHAR